MKGKNPRGNFNKGKPGFKSNKMVVTPHRFPGVFMTKGDYKTSSFLLTKNYVPGQSVYNEKRISVEVQGQKIEYRVWNPFRSKIAASIVGGIKDIYIRPQAKILYLGASSGTTVSHVSDIVGPKGIVYAIQFSNRVGRELLNMAKKRTNVVPIIHDARKPVQYRFMVGMVDTVFADVAQPDQARILAQNVSMYLKNGGNFMISIKASCIDSTQQPQVIFAGEIQKLRQYGLTPQKRITLQPYQRHHVVVIGSYRKQ